MDIDELLEAEASQSYAEEIKIEILEAQNKGITLLEFDRTSLADAFPPVECSSATYNVAWLKAYLYKHCPGWKITGPSSDRKVAIKFHGN